MQAKEIKILMADDEPDVLSVMAKKVALEGFKVVTAADGQEAWEKIQSEDPDIIILDLSMPKLHGLEVLKNVRSNPPSAKWQPVIIVSAHGELQDIQKGFSLEADHYITKPCSVSDVVKAIHTMISLIPQHKPNEKPESEKK